MSAELHVRSEVPPVSWEDFTSRYPNNPHPIGSMALDGYVTGPPNFTWEGPYYNANHHEGVVRLATLSTAQQVQRDLRMGLYRPFTFNGEFSPHVFVNDCDQDVCLAWYLLENPAEATDPSYKLNRLMDVAGTLDVTSGMFPYKRDMELLGKLAWVFEPYTEFRASGEMARKDNAQYEDVIRTVGRRIGMHLVDRGESTALDTGYEVLYGNGVWTMIRERGKDGRVGAVMDGIEAYVSVQSLPNDRWRYTLGRLSQFVPFDIPNILKVLNDAEGNDDDLWGGADTIAGSPRVGASRLAPEEVGRIINDCLAAAKQG